MKIIRKMEEPETSEQAGKKFLDEVNHYVVFLEELKCVDLFFLLGLKIKDIKEPLQNVDCKVGGELFTLQTPTVTAGPRKMPELQTCQNFPG